MKYTKAKLLVLLHDVSSHESVLLYEFPIRHDESVPGPFVLGEAATLFDEVSFVVAGRVVSGRVFDNDHSGLEPDAYEIYIEINAVDDVPYGINGRKPGYVEELVNVLHESLGCWTPSWADEECLKPPTPGEPEAQPCGQGD